MKKKHLLGTLLTLSTVTLTLAACENNKKDDSTKTSSSSMFKSAVPAKSIKQGGSVNVAIQSDTPITGIFLDELAVNTTDFQADQFGDEPLFKFDNNYKYIKGGPADISFNRKNKTATITINSKLKWSDGKPVVARDYQYSYEIIANKASKSVRYDAKLANLKGLAEYHDGKSKTISGIELPDGADGRKVVLHFKKMLPGMNHIGSGYVWGNAAPYHYLKDVPFNKLISSDKVRKNPIFFGAYKLDRVVRGESTIWSPNKYYYLGKPKLDKITATVIPVSNTTQAIKNKKFDVINVVNSQWENVKNTEGVNFIAKVPLQYTYLGFKVGKWDAKTSKNVMNPKAKMNNRALRQAIAYGMNVNQVYKKYSHGLTFRVPTLIPAQFGQYFDKNVKGYTFNLKKGNQLLDKAGYKKKGTYRVQPNGKPLTIYLAAANGSETVIENYIDQWKKLGLNVKLVNGRLMENNSFQAALQDDSSKIDMFINAWQLAYEPSPASIYGESTPLNFGRFVTKENNKLLQEIDSEKAFNNNYRINKFHEWQAYMNKEAYVVPIANAYAITAVNSKLTGYSLEPSKDMGHGYPNWYYVGYAK